MSPRDYWSLRLLHKANVFPASGITAQTLENKITRLSNTLNWVWSHALPRLLMGSFRYEGRESDGKSYDQKAREGKEQTYGKRMANKVAEFNRTGNQEMLIDVFNYVLLEITQPTHPLTHFKSTERYD